MLVDELNASLFNFGVHIDGVHVDKVAIPKDYAELTAKMQQQTLQQRMLDDEATSTRRREQLAFDAVHGQTVQRQEVKMSLLSNYCTYSHLNTQCKPTIYFKCPL